MSVTQLALPLLTLSAREQAWRDYLRAWDALQPLARNGFEEDEDHHRRRVAAQRRVEQLHAAWLTTLETQL